MDAYRLSHIWRLKDNLQEFVLYYHVGLNYSAGLAASTHLDIHLSLIIQAGLEFVILLTQPPKCVCHHAQL